MARKQVLLISSVVIISVALFSACKKEEPPKPQPEAAPVNDSVVRKKTEVSVPDIVKGKWKAVKLSIMDKEKNKEGFVVIDIGKTMKVNDTDLVIKVENFLPHFVMDGTTLTSSSNSTKNPAVLVQITVPQYARCATSKI
jgi:hypothetical protein